jgi:glycerate-2-kinase
MAIEEWSILMRNGQPIDAPVDLTGGEDAILAGAQTYGGNQNAELCLCCCKNFKVEN